MSPSCISSTSRADSPAAWPGWPRRRRPVSAQRSGSAVSIFRAEAASIALLDEGSGTLKFVVAAGAQGEPVVGLTIPPTQGLAGYVFSTGESIALSDPSKDPRFGRGVAESTGFMPR